MRIYSYVVARDFGFAPNPFHGVCTLATCKPRIRKLALTGDWVIGTGSATAKRADRLVYAMRVEEAMPFQSYWDDPRFHLKKPNLHASKKLAFGDNIYHRHAPNEPWIQINSHHSFEDGAPNPGNITNDTQTDRLLISRDYVYFGGSGPSIPTDLRDFGGEDLCAHRGHKSRFSPAFVEAVVSWIRSLGVSGYAGEPLDWRKTA